MYRVDPPEHGPWELEDFPDSIEIDGMVFDKSRRNQPYSGVVAQYRQAVPLNSAHLMVLDGGLWKIDHVDEYNPDMGHPVKHFFIDHPIGKVLTYTGGGIIGMGIAIARGKRDAKTQ